MQCNIDAKGKAFRMGIGVVMLAIGLPLAALVLAGVLPGGWFWVCPIMFIASGFFGIFEGRKGWCAVRAMGFKTRV